MADRDPIEHEVKCWPGPFAEVRARRKPWELRKNDRDYRTDDYLTQREWSPDAEDYTGEVERHRIGWMLEGPAFGLPAGYVIFTLDEVCAAAAHQAHDREAGDLDLYDEKVQAGIDWTMRQWGRALGLTTWTQGDGSESVEGDVHAEIHTILVDAGLRDEWTSEMASLPCSVGGEADLQLLSEIISDDEIARIHGHANFGPTMTPRDVVNDGVRKTAVGYHCGHTQFCILREHGLITKPRGMSYDVALTKKGKKYARCLSIFRQPEGRGEAANGPDEALFWFLKVLNAVGGEVPAGDGYSVVAAFCDDRGDDDDTYNISEAAGWSRTTHSGWGDGNATVSITDAGRAVLWEAQAQRRAPNAAGVTK